MNASWPEMILYLVFAIGTAVSLFAFFWARRLSRAGLVPKAVREDSTFEAFLDGPCVGGAVEVKAASPKALMDILVLNLQNPANFASPAWARRKKFDIGQVQVDRASDEVLGFTATGLSVSEGMVSVEPGALEGTVRARWALRCPGCQTMLLVGQCWALLLGLPASCIVPAVIYLFVLSSSNPAVSGQFVQVVQVAQLLWEPFLFVGLSTQMLKSAGRHLELLVSASAYESTTGRQAFPGVQA